MTRNSAGIFWGHVQQTDTCWLWTGRQDRKGYGRLGWQGRPNRFAHHVALELSGRERPAGLVVDHLCRVHNCVNPAHLEWVTTQENTRRGVPFGGFNAHGNADKTHCPHSHPYDEENTYVDARGWRKCRACRAAGMRRAKKVATT